MKMRKLLVMAGLAVLALTAGCGNEDDAYQSASSAEDRGVTSSTAMGPGVTIAEAKSSELDGPLLVNGFLLAVGGEVRLCSALLESLPPQCGGESLAVEGFDPTSVDGTQSEGDTTWTSDAIQLLGEVENSVISVSGASSG